MRIFALAMFLLAPTMLSACGGKSDDTPKPAEEPSDGIIRVLAIGNSFSQDAVEQYLWELANAQGKKVIIGNMYIGGCSLETHLNNANNNSAAYEYRKIMNGNKATTSNVRLTTALTDEKWDYISLQQVSGYSGVYSSFEASLPALARYVRAQSGNKKVKLILHQTWAYAKNYNTTDFERYGKDQLGMHAAIADAYTRAAALVSADFVVPSGTAVQNGRTSYLGDSYNRDGTHLELTYGRYTAACAWFEKIFGISVVGNTYKPAGLHAYNAEIAQQAAHAAVLKPNQVTELTAYKDGLPETENDKTLANHIWINFGSTSGATPWNNVSSVSSTTKVPLIDLQSIQTGISIHVSKAFGGINTNGPTSTSVTGWVISSTVSPSSFWGNTGQAFEGQVTGTTELMVTSLNKAQQYVFSFFGSRSSVSDNRETQFTVTGTNSDVLLLDAANNTTQMVTSKSITPDASGRVTVSLTSGPANTNTNGFYYINAMRIAPAQ